MALEYLVVLVACAPIAASVIVFVFALSVVDKPQRIEAIKAMTDFVLALQPGRRR